MNAGWLKYLPNFIREKLEARHGLQAIIGNIGWLFADKVLRMGVGLFVGVWIARYLGPEQFGLWNYAAAFTALFGAFATLGLDGIVVRELVKNPERQNELLGSAFALKLIGGVITLLIATSAITVVRSGETLTLWLVGLSAAGFIFQSANVVDFYFQAKLKSRYTVYAANASFVLITLVKIVLLLTSAPLIAFAWAGLGEIALTAIFLLVAYRANHHNMRSWRYEPRIVRDLLRDSWPLILSGLATMIYMRIDQVMIGQILGDKEVGLFSVAVRISELWFFIPMAIISSVFPAIIADKEQGEAVYLQRLQKLYDLMVMLALSVAIPLTFFSDWLVVMLFGVTYLHAGIVLAIHVWSGVFIFIGVASGQWFLTENLQRFAFYRTLFGALLNIGLNYIFIPRYGIVGAAISTVVSQMAVSYLFDIASTKTRGQFLLKTKSFFFFLRFNDWMRNS
jgi:PST family polysaccharide transporter